MPTALRTASICAICCSKKRIAFDIAARPAVAETDHPMPDVEKKRLALLLAVVADIDTGFDLLVDDPAQCRLANPVELGPTPWFGS